ncbi:uncharacterized protein JCM15063_002940 [Sporobolomyces koalae]|uniref:uncharacterized protein n=1 Tax=Sporobolomyces koalae TaxID=500713 RepID=UPI003181CF6D
MSSSLGLQSSLAGVQPSPSHILSFAHSPATPVTQLFQRKELVGKGAYGGVYKGIHTPTGTVVALKVIDLDTPDDDISEIQKEVALLSELRDAARHNITLYHGCYLNGYELWIAMDFASGGSIRTLMKSGPIEEKYAALIVREVLVALSFLHRQDIIHRDVKAANILLTQTGKILLCDFGVAAHLQTNSKRSTFTGTPLWMAPEVITDGKLYDTKADIWSLGITLYEIMVGNPPHFGIEPLRACSIIPTEEPPTLPREYQDHSTTNLKEFLASCLQLDPTDRPTAEELSKTKWIKSASKLPMVLLRELIVRYVSWIQSGGQRTSIVGTLPGMQDLVHQEDTFELASQREEGWDFDVEPISEQEDLAHTLGFGTLEGLGDEPARTTTTTTVESLDELAAKNSKRPPKPVVPPTTTTTTNRKHPLLRLFDVESNPYAQPTASTSTTTALASNPVISLPVSSLNTVKPTIALPSFDDPASSSETSNSTDSSGGGIINLPSFGNTYKGGFGGATTGTAGWGGAGWGSSTATTGGGGSQFFDDSSSSPFDTINGSNFHQNPFGIEDQYSSAAVTPSTVRGNPFNDGNSQHQSRSWDPRTSWDRQDHQPEQEAWDGFGQARDEAIEENNVETWGKNKLLAEGGGGGANGFKFGGISTTTNGPQVSKDPTILESEEPNRPPPQTLLSRRRADTAPSSRPPQSEPLVTSNSTDGSLAIQASNNGGYPPLGPGLPRTTTFTTPASTSITSTSPLGEPGGFPPLGPGLPRSKSSGLPKLHEEEDMGDVTTEMNRPFGGGSTKPFQFGGSQQRERATTLLSQGESRPTFNKLGTNEGWTNPGERKRAGSDGRRQGLKVTLAYGFIAVLFFPLLIMIPQIAIGQQQQHQLPFTSVTSPSPAATPTFSPASRFPPPSQQHRRQASSLSIHSPVPEPISPIGESVPIQGHRQKQLSTSSTHSNVNTTTMNGGFLTASPTSSISLSPSTSTSSLSNFVVPGTGGQDQDVATPLAKSTFTLTSTAIGYPFPPVGDLAVPSSRSLSSSSSLDPTPAGGPPPLPRPENNNDDDQVDVYTPMIPPLDYSTLSTRDSVQLELDEIVNGLQDWFEVVKDGIDRVLQDRQFDQVWFGTQTEGPEMIDPETTNPTNLKEVNTVQV